ncbi:hypothetical protein LMH73_015245 [Vibrio splendidus]|nr:hypothetical protein [Vibrio splendidus]MCC4882874.1 hypothetical protein [Vibrio splendidus]
MQTTATEYSKSSARMQEIAKTLEQGMSNPDVDMLAPLMSEAFELNKTMSERIENAKMLKEQIWNKKNEED